MSERSDPYMSLETRIFKDHHEIMLYVALICAIIAVVLGGLGTKAYYDVAHNPNEDGSFNHVKLNSGLTSDGAINANNNINLNNASTIVHDGSLTTEIDGDLSNYTSITKYNLINGTMVKYSIKLNFNGLTPNATNGDIFGLDGAASTVANLPTNFVLQQGQVRCSTATGSTAAHNIIIGSTDNEAEDAAPTTGTFVQVYTNLNCNSASTNFEPFETVPLEAAPSTMRYIYLTTNGTGNGTTAYTAGQIIIELVGYINNDSSNATALPLARSFKAPVRSLTAAATLNISDSHTTYILNLAGGFTVTLPAPSTSGLYFKFIVGTAPTTAYIITSGTADTILGGLTTGEDAAGSTDTEVSGGADSINFVANTAVIGDWIELISDGTNYYAFGYANVQDGITYTG